MSDIGLLSLLQERIAKLKKEGKFLTKAQRQQQAKAQAMLDSMKKQGVYVLSLPSQFNLKTLFAQQSKDMYTCKHLLTV